jgi:hypothetical protein
MRDDEVVVDERMQHLHCSVQGDQLVQLEDFSCLTASWYVCGDAALGQSARHLTAVTSTRNGIYDNRCVFASLTGLRQVTAGDGHGAQHAISCS